MPRIFLVAFAVLAFAVAAPVASASATEPIVGTWRLEGDNGSVRFEPVSDAAAGQFCGTAIGNGFTGRRVGCMTGSGASYRGSITDLRSGRTYRGRATVTGDAIALKGCVLGGIICRTTKGRRR